MSLLAQIAAARAQRAAALPHRDRVQVYGPSSPESPGGEDSWGNPLPPTPGVPTLGPSLPALASRISSADALAAGLSAEADNWRVVVNRPDVATPSQTVRVTLGDGRAFDLAVRQCSGTDLTVLEGVRV